MPDEHPQPFDMRSPPPPRAAQTPISWKARGNFSGTKANFEIKLRWIVPQFLAHKPVNFASLTDSFFVSFQNYWIFDLKCKHCKHKTAFRTRKVTGTFEKWASAPTPLYKPFKYVPQRIRFLLRFGLKTDVDFAHFALESSMVFEVGMNVFSVSILKE